MSNETPVVFESTEGMTRDCAQGLRHLLLACADTKLLLGYHYGEWTFGTPELEAAVASCSLAQAELGHVRLLCAVLSQHFGDDPDALVDARTAEEFANVRFLDRAIPHWPAFVAMNYVVDLAVTRLLHTMRGSTFKPVHMSVGKMLEEERYHLHHGRGWFRTLARRGGDDARALARHAEDALAAVSEWLGPAGEPQDAALVAAGMKEIDNRAVYAAVVGDTTDLAREHGLEVTPSEPRALDDWSPRNRRAGGGGPDEDILFHLRGSKNEIFKLR